MPCLMAIQVLLLLWKLAPVRAAIAVLDTHTVHALVRYILETVLVCSKQPLLAPFVVEKSCGNTSR